MKKIKKKIMKCFLIFFKNSINNNLWLMEQQDKRKTFLYQLFVESISDKQHYIIHIIMDLISLLNLLCVTIVIKVK